MYIYIIYTYIHRIYGVRYVHTHLHTQVMLTIKQYINIIQYPQSPLVPTGPPWSLSIPSCSRAATPLATCPVLRCPAGKVAQCLTSAAKLRGSAADLKKR